MWLYISNVNIPPSWTSIGLLGLIKLPTLTGTISKIFYPSSETDKSVYPNATPFKWIYYLSSDK